MIKGLAFDRNAKIPLPYVARLPGPTIDVLGKTQDQQGDLKEILSITGTNPQTGEEITNPDLTAPKEGGQLRMVTVTEWEVRVGASTSLDGFKRN